MSDSVPHLLREIHRLRRYLRDLKQELDLFPVTLKAYQNKVAKEEKALKDFQDGIKKLKVLINDREVSLRATNQLLVKYEKQANELTTPKEVEAKQTEIANTRTQIANLEDEILAKMAELDERNAALPGVEAQLAKARQQLANFDSEWQERSDRLQKEMKAASEELVGYEARLPAVAKGPYDRLIKAYGPDGLARVKDRSCGQCHTSLSADQVAELMMGRFLCCQSCGRAVYLAE